MPLRRRAPRRTSRTADGAADADDVPTGRGAGRDRPRQGRAPHRAPCRAGARARRDACASCSSVTWTSSTDRGKATTRASPCTADIDPADLPDLLAHYRVAPRPVSVRRSRDLQLHADRSVVGGTAGAGAADRRAGRARAREAAPGIVMTEAEWHDEARMLTRFESLLSADRPRATPPRRCRPRPARTLPQMADETLACYDGRSPRRRRGAWRCRRRGCATGSAMWHGRLRRRPPGDRWPRWPRSPARQAMRAPDPWSGMSVRLAAAAPLDAKPRPR